MPALDSLRVTSQLAESQLAESLYVGVRNRVRVRVRVRDRFRDGLGIGCWDSASWAGTM